MAPEQILGASADARADLFSLGVILYQLLAGARPFERDAGSARRSGFGGRGETAPPLRERATDVSAELAALVTRLLARHPEDRFARADDVATRLERFVEEGAGEPPERVVLRALIEAGLVPGELPPAPPRPKRVAPRRPLRVGAVGVAAVVLGVVLIALLSHGAARGRPGEAVRGLELAPKNGGTLRIVAAPWAEVSIDGQPFDTTPIGRPVPLAAGTHLVRYAHPNALPETRTVTIAPGDTASLEVTMHVTDGDAAAPAVSATAPAPPPAGSEEVR